MRRLLIAVCVILVGFCVSAPAQNAGSGRKDETPAKAAPQSIEPRMKALMQAGDYEQMLKVGTDAMKTLPPGREQDMARLFTWLAARELYTTKGAHRAEFSALTDAIAEKMEPKDMASVMPVVLMQTYAMVGEPGKAKTLGEKVLKALALPGKEGAPEDQQLAMRKQRVAAMVKSLLPQLERIGKPAPTIELTDLQGKKVTLADYKGKVLLIDFWATWCGPCVQEVPNVVKLYNAKHAEGFAILGLSLDQDKQKLEAFMKETGMVWRGCFLGGWEHPVVKEYSVRAIPSMFLVDRAGNIRYTGLRGQALDRAVDELLKEKPEAPAKAE